MEKVEARCKDSYTISSQANRLAQFTSKIGVDKFHLVGDSMGGAIAFFSHSSILIV